MGWGEWEAAPRWDVPGQRDEALSRRLWLPDFHALIWDLSTWSLLWGEELERWPESLGSLVLCSLLSFWDSCSGVRVWQLGRWDQLGGKTLRVTSWHIHGMWNHPSHLGNTSLGIGACSLCPRWGKCVISPGGNAWVKDQAVGSLCCFMDTSYLQLEVLPPTWTQLSQFEFLVLSPYQDVVFPLIFLKPLAIPSWFTSLCLRGSLRQTWPLPLLGTSESRWVTGEKKTSPHLHK